MSHQNVEMVLGLHPSPNVDTAQLVRDDDQAEAWLETLAPFFQRDLECVSRGLPDGERTYFGLEGLRAALRDRYATWATHRSEPQEAVDRGDRVLLLQTDYGRRGDSAEEIRHSSGHVFTFRDGKIARWEMYADRADAFEAVGLAGMHLTSEDWKELRRGLGATHVQRADGTAVCDGTLVNAINDAQTNELVIHVLDETGRLTKVIPSSEAVELLPNTSATRVLVVTDAVEPEPGRGVRARGASQP